MFQKSNLHLQLYFLFSGLYNECFYSSLLEPIVAFFPKAFLNHRLGRLSLYLSQMKHNKYEEIVVYHLD